MERIKKWFLETILAIAAALFVITIFFKHE